MPYKNKEKEKEYYKEYRKKHKEELKEYREKHKEKRKKYHKKYNEKYKDKIKEKHNIYMKKYHKKLYKKAINRLCDYYNLKKPICFIDKKEKTQHNFLVIDHKKEQETNLKDKYVGGVLYTYIITCKKEELNNYQLLCSEHNIIKHAYYYFYLKLKTKNNKYTKKAYEMYNRLFIYDKEKLKNELIKEGKKYLLLKDDNNVE